jgi:autotransporter-associated beta strand protein
MAGAGTPILFGTGGITKTGGGTLQLNAVANTFTGGLVVSQGAVEFTSANRLGSEASLNATAVTVNGGALRVTSTGSGTITSALNRGYALGNATGTIEVTNSAITYIIAGAVTDVVGQNGNLTKTGLGVLRLTNNNTFSGVTRVESGTLQSTRSVALASSALVVVTNASSTLALNYGGSENYSQEEVGTLLGKTTFASTSTALGFHTADGNGTLATNLTIAAGLTKLGANTLTLTGTNNYTGATTVSAGTLNLNTTTGSAAGSTTSVSVTNGAILLISQSDQVNNTATVSLSGGTIQLGGVVSETFGALSVTSASFLDFNNAEGVNISFGTYAPTQKITVNNFIGFSTLTFKSDMTTFISNPALFSFANGFSSALWDEPNTTFTITAIPEPGTILAAIGLAGLFAWPLRRHFLRRSDRQA